MSKRLKRAKVRKPALRTVLLELEKFKQLYGKVLAESDLNATKAKAAEKRLIELKKLYADAQQELARQRGYIERVQEDDAANDPLVEIDVPDHNGRGEMVKRKMPARAYMRFAEPPRMVSTNFIDTYDPLNRRREEPTHWTNW
jgi:hypothetical protein